jgi:hypothetical protein
MHDCGHDGDPVPVVRGLLKWGVAGRLCLCDQQLIIVGHSDSTEMIQSVKDKKRKAGYRVSPNLNNTCFSTAILRLRNLVRSVVREMPSSSLA